MKKLPLYRNSILALSIGLVSIFLIFGALLKIQSYKINIILTDNLQKINALFGENNNNNIITKGKKTSMNFKIGSFYVDFIINHNISTLFTGIYPIHKRVYFNDNIVLTGKGKLTNEGNLSVNYSSLNNPLYFNSMIIQPKNTTGFLTIQNGNISGSINSPIITVSPKQISNNLNHNLLGLRIEGFNKTFSNLEKNDNLLSTISIENITNTLFSLNNVFVINELRKENGKIKGFGEIDINYFSNILNINEKINGTFSIKNIKKELVPADRINFKQKNKWVFSGNDIFIGSTKNNIQIENLIIGEGIVKVEASLNGNYLYWLTDIIKNKQFKDKKINSGESGFDIKLLNNRIHISIFNLN